MSPETIADVLASRGRESSGGVGKRLGLTRNQVIGIRHRAKSCLSRPEVRAAYDRHMAALGPAVEETAEAPTPLEEYREAEPLASTQDTAAPPPESPPATVRGAVPSTEAALPARDRAALAMLPRDVSAAAVAVGLLRSDTCRWPVGDPADPGFRFCRAPAPVERPYCTACARIAYGHQPGRFAPRAFVGATSRRAA